MVLVIWIAGAKFACAEEPFFLRSADGSYQLRVRGYVNFDGRFFQNDQQRPATDTFVLRRVRPVFEATLAKFFELRIMPDFGEGRTVLQDAYLDARFSTKARLRAGKYKAPFGLERLQSATDLLFVERALPTNLVPNRDLGVQLSGDLLSERLSYAFGVFNGVPDGGSADADVNDGKDLVARLFVHPFKGAGPERLQGLGLGLAISFGDQEGTVSGPGLPSFRTAGQQTFFVYRADNTQAGTVIADGDRHRIGPQAYYFQGCLGGMVEYARSSQEVRTATSSDSLTHDSWQVAGAWMLTDDEATYRGVAPKRPFDRAAGQLGAIQIVTRYSQLSIDKDTFPVFANLASSARKAREWGLGANWYLNRNVKIMTDYIHTTFDGGGSNGDREAENVVLSRFQIAY
jgi:phosphate-selective porin OprO/OprP